MTTVMTHEGKIGETRAIRPLVAGNWKMNGLVASLNEAGKVADRMAEAGFKAQTDVMICPPATLILPLAARANSTKAGASKLIVGAQDCHAKASGAHTGDIAAEMLRDAGARAVIVGHSERRADHGETDAIVRAKCEAALRAGLIAIVCVGETAVERQAGQTLDVVRRQLAGSLPDGCKAAATVVAYEPVWAIGTGLTPTAADVAAVHKVLREEVAHRFGSEGTRMRLLYGGSVKASNARELMAVANVDGALVGGASLKADDFLGIVAAYV